MPVTQFLGGSGDGLSAYDIAKRGGGMGNTVIRVLLEIFWPEVGEPRGQDSQAHMIHVGSYLGTCSHKVYKT